MRRLPSFILLVFATVLFTLGAAAQTGGSYNIVRSVIGSGATTASGGSYTLNGTVGQAATGPSFGGSYGLSSGFWTTDVIVPTAVQGLLGISAETPITIPLYLILLSLICLTTFLIYSIKTRRQ